MNRWYADTSKHAAYSGGIKYHGYGLVQTTHVYNFHAVQDMLKSRYNITINLMAQPELLLKIEYAAPAFCQYWSTRDIVAKCERQDWSAVRSAVFGGNDAPGAARIKYAADYLIPRARI